MNAFFILIAVDIIVFIFGYFLFRKTFFLEKNLLSKIKTIWIIIMIILFLMAWHTESGKIIWEDMKKHNCLKRK